MLLQITVQIGAKFKNRTLCSTVMVISILGAALCNLQLKTRHEV